MIRKILQIILSIVSVIISIFLLIVFYAWMQVNIFNMSYANIFGFSLFDVVTGSMSGTIEINDYVVVKETNNIEVSDIITFKEGKNFITHRVVEIRGEKLVTRGDANNSSDKEISYNQVVGKVVFIIDDAGIWKDVLVDKKVFIPIIITLILFVIFFSIEEKKYKQIVKKANFKLLEDDNDVKKKEIKVKARLDLLDDEKKDKNK